MKMSQNLQNYIGCRPHIFFRLVVLNSVSKNHYWFTQMTFFMKLPHPNDLLKDLCHPFVQIFSGTLTPHRQHSCVVLSMFLFMQQTHRSYSHRQQLYRLSPLLLCSAPSDGHPCNVEQGIFYLLTEQFSYRTGQGADKVLFSMQSPQFQSALTRSAPDFNCMQAEEDNGVPAGQVKVYKHKVLLKSSHRGHLHDQHMTIIMTYS